MVIRGLCKKSFGRQGKNSPDMQTTCYTKCLDCIAFCKEELSLHKSKIMGQKNFRNVGIATIVAVYILIGVGGLVRMAGAGMGCPDWPRCFGQWVPPTDSSELPPNYQQKYVEERQRKNERIARYLRVLGFEALADKITKDKSIQEVTYFDTTKAWIEYVNRLVGVLIGFLIFLTLLFSFAYRKTNPKIPLLAFLAFVLVGIEGWIGSVVVSTNLLPNLITVHMGLAVLIVFMLTYIVVVPKGKLAYPTPQVRTKDFTVLLWTLRVAFFLTLLQVLLGTQVREAIDVVAKQVGEAGRGTWVGKLGLEFYVHRSFSWLLLGANVYFFYLCKKNVVWQWAIFRKFALFALILCLVELCMGVALAYGGMPFYLQPLHLLAGVVLVGVQYLLIIWFKNQENLNLR
ncbi:MAG: heme A synthase [Bacteroidetes bacterium]|nr:MAG: heme A synthase [Bacteroidota bacterium]